jgi:hypothetical protein
MILSTGRMRIWTLWSMSMKCECGLGSEVYDRSPRPCFCWQGRGGGSEDDSEYWSDEDMDPMAYEYEM